MSTAKLILFLLLMAALFIGYTLHKLWGRLIDPKRSLLHFLLLIAVNLLSVFILVFLFTWVIFYFHGFFFK